MKVLLLAFACDAEDVSETWCSYQWTKRLVAKHEATVLVYNRRARRGVAARQLPGARIVEWTEPRVLTRTGAFNHILKPGYLDYYVRARRFLRRLLQEESFDLIHQYEPFAPRYPSPAAGLGVPLLLGPVGGAVPTPPGFETELERNSAWFMRLRRLDAWRFRYDPWLRHTYASADLVLGVAPYVRELLAALPMKRFACLSETGVEELPARVERRQRRAGEIRLLYVGRIVRSKGVRDAIRALASVADLPGVQLDILGDGDDRRACEAEAVALGIAERVRFHGWQPRERVAVAYAEADAFLFPSLREASGTVVAEAMSHGLPCIVAANGGPGHSVSEECGIRVPPTTPAEYALELGAAIRSLAMDPARCARMGDDARRRVADEQLWDRKIERLDSYYRELVAQCRAATHPTKSFREVPIHV